MLGSGSGVDYPPTRLPALGWGTVGTVRRGQGVGWRGAVVGWGYSTGKPKAALHLGRCVVIVHVLTQGFGEGSSHLCAI
jgi:hypothetical protein